jgi:uncharacterized protein
VPSEPVTVDCDFRKWGDAAHWRFPTTLLGRDEHGTWLGNTPPTPYTGPRGAGEWTHAFAILVPEDAWWVASFNARAAWKTTDVEIYVDVTTVPTWLDQTHMTAIDLDLDVIRRFDGHVYIDDEDEFEEHRVKFDYPDDVVAQALRTTAELVQALEPGREPFGEAGRRWLEKT